MKHRHLKYQKLITFSRWSRKKYAVLVSLGKQIKIGNIRLEICQLALLKAEKSQVLIVSNHSDRIEEEVPDDIIEAQLSELRAISITTKSETFACMRTHNILSKYYQQIVLRYQILHKEISFFVSSDMLNSLKCHAEFISASRF